MLGELLIADGRSSFYQWDSNQLLAVYDFPVGSELHFDMPNIDVPVSMKVYELNGETVCRVPDELLQVSGAFTVWAYVTDDYGSRTVYETTFNVKKREKPPGYIYTPTEQGSYNSLLNRITSLEGEVDDALESISKLPCILGSGAPTTATEGAVGRFYMDTDTGDVYKCTAVTDGSYTWEEFKSCSTESSSTGGVSSEETDQIYEIGKNILDPSKTLYNGDGDINPTTGALGDGTSYIYGKYNLNVGETYTVSKIAPAGFGFLTAYLYFYNADGSYSGNANIVTMGAATEQKTFTANYPVLIVKALKEITPYNLQIEQGETATEYEEFSVVLKENVKVPVVGSGILSTTAKTLIPAVNELYEIISDVPALKEDAQTAIEDVAAIEKVLPRLNEEITSWTSGFIDANGTAAANANFAYSNKVRLQAGRTYYVGESYMTYTVCYDLDGNFVGRNTCDGMTIAHRATHGTAETYFGTITVGETDIYVVLQTITAKSGNAYISNFGYEKTSSEICENLFVNKSLLGKKVLILGDSISTGDTSAKVNSGEKYGGYNKWVEQLIDENYFADCNVRNDSIHATGFVARFNGEDDLITRLRETADTDYDLVIVFAGINDSLRANNIVVGFGMDDQGNKETDITKYFVPAVDTFFAELVEKFVDARICVVLPLRTRYKYAGHNDSSPGTLYDGSTSKLETDYADYIAKVAEEYCLPVLDATRHSGFAPFNSTFAEKWVCKAAKSAGDPTLVPDGVHPNEEYCRKYLAKYIRGFIDGLI